MRKIIFRGKSFVTGGMVYGDLIQWKNGARDILVNDLDTGEKTKFRVSPETVGQFTGFTDKNGKKIFEGDILCDDECIGKINYGDSSYTYEWKLRRYLKSDFYRNCILSDFTRLGNLEVIGNIHENPELLKEGVKNG
jgi:uncharacterized phage protein (TIGR01671 family)